MKKPKNANTLLNDLVPGAPDDSIPGRNDFSRELKNRHIQLISLGGAIGVGLFLGSAEAIEKAGPALIFAYAIAGALIFIVVRALGELITYRPITGSFATYAEEFIGPWAGFVTGWSYWLNWVLVGIAEITAIAIYTKYWYPDIPQWIPALVSLAILFAMNMMKVRVFGELEFWLSLIKIIAIIMLIVVGISIIVFGYGGINDSAQFSNLWSHGGLLPKGFLSLLAVLPIATFAFGGIELIGVTAGEAQNPRFTIPRAINKVLYRIIIFYIGALVIILSLVPWNELNRNISPFVSAFDDVGIPFAAGIMNFVILSAAASSCNSGIFSTGRMLHTLAKAKQAPSIFAKLNEGHIPANGIVFSISAMLVGVFLNYLIPEKIFGYVLSMVIVTQLWTWTIIIVAHMGFRKAVKIGKCQPVPYKLPWAPYSNWVAICYFATIAISMVINDNMRVIILLAPVWFLALMAAYIANKRRSSV